jgi:hypothetical protein
MTWAAICRNYVAKYRSFIVAAREMESIPRSRF